VIVRRFYAGPRKVSLQTFGPSQCIPASEKFVFYISCTPRIINCTRIPTEKTKYETTLLLYLHSEKKACFEKLFETISCILEDLFEKTRSKKYILVSITKFRKVIFTKSKMVILNIMRVKEVSRILHNFFI